MRGAISEPGIEPIVYMCISWNEAVDTKRSRSVFGGVPGRWFWQAEICLKTTTTETAELMARCYVGALGRGTCYSRGKGRGGKEEQKHGEGR